MPLPVQQQPSPTTDRDPTRAPVACPNCSTSDSESWAIASDVEYRTTPDSYEYRRCRACGVVFLADPPADQLVGVRR